MIYSPDSRPPPPVSAIGGKGRALLQMSVAGLPVPTPLCIGTAAYEHFVARNHLKEKISLELYRKQIRDMRWEEIWDASLRIQNLFMKAPLGAELEKYLLDSIRRGFGSKPLVVRSSAPDEDGRNASFAGLHESYSNISGAAEITKKIKMVWASLWSDRAILYRQDLGIEVLDRSMGVVVQPFIDGEASGVLFTQNPLDGSQLVVEAVHGLNQGLVDGTVEPDRWTIRRDDLTVEHHHSPEQRDRCFVRSATGGIACTTVDWKRCEYPPLSAASLAELVSLGVEIENFFGVGQDIEWTLKDGMWSVLQSRPITSGTEERTGDGRTWYLSMNRSYEHLLRLGKTITGSLLPRMDDDYSDLAAVNLRSLSKRDLAAELRRRRSINERWTSIYWSEFIPFAHGVRLFGEVYNDVMEPDDPFEFVSLLSGQNLLSTERNDLLRACARLAPADGDLLENLKLGLLDGSGDGSFQKHIRRLKSHFSVDFIGVGDPGAVERVICAMILQYALLDEKIRHSPAGGCEQLERNFIRRAGKMIGVDPSDLLTMARESFRIRDDDNIHIGRIGQELARAVEHARTVLESAGTRVSRGLSAETLAALLEGNTVVEDAGLSRDAEERPESIPSARVRARQLQGQPASRGFATGIARVVEQSGDLADFKKGEILIIDSIDPTMTFFAPLAAAIVERRGGMLIHGAIIAREYGIPCLTGVVEATKYIASGDWVTVDAHLGICTVRGKGGVQARPVSNYLERVIGNGYGAGDKHTSNSRGGHMTEKEHKPALDRIQKAKLLFASGQVKESVQAFTRAECEGAELVDIWQSRGAALLALGQYKAAETDFTNVLEVQRDNERAFYYRGIAHAAQGHHRRAINDLTASLSRNNNRGIAHLIRGLAYAELGNTSDAVLDINSAGSFSDAELNSYAKLFGTTANPFKNARAMMAEENAPWNNLLDRSSAEKLVKLLQ